MDVERLPCMGGALLMRRTIDVAIGHMTKEVN
jgi:hypothetical protein